MIQARGHCLFNQIRIITYLFWSLNIFLFISFLVGFCRMFLFCVFSWLVEKYKSVTLMLMRFWSEISRMLLSMHLGLIILRLKKCVFCNSAKSKCHNVPVSPRALASVCITTGSWEKKVRLSKSRWSKLLWLNFSLVPGSPSF